MLDPTPLATADAQLVPDTLTAMVSAAEGVGDVVLGDICGPTAQRLVKRGEGCVVRPLSGSTCTTRRFGRGLGGLGNVTGRDTRISFNDNYGGVLIGTGIGRGGFTAGLVPATWRRD